MHRTYMCVNKDCSYYNLPVVIVCNHTGWAGLYYLPMLECQCGDEPLLTHIDGKKVNES